MVAMLESPSNNHFDSRIESLRGLAALAVVITHSSAALQVDNSPAYWVVRFTDRSLAQHILSLLSALCNANAAVVVFFVLSGYVLTLSLSHQKADTTSDRRVISTYAIRRLFRLLPPMWGSLLLMWIVMSVIPRPMNNESFSLWFKNVFVWDIRPWDVLLNAVLVNFRINAVTWTMYIEVIGSVFIPISLTICMYFGRYASLWILALLALLAFVAYPPSLTGLPDSPQLALTYLVCFQAGLVLAHFEEKLFPPALLCLAAMTVFGVQRFRSPPNSLGILLLTVAATALLAGIIRGAFGGFLNHKPLRFLGRVSYSLYLFHLPVVYITSLIAVALGVARANGIVPTLFMFVITIPLSLLLAWAGYETVERWSMAAGRAISHRWSAR